MLVKFLRITFRRLSKVFISQITKWTSSTKRSMMSPTPMRDSSSPNGLRDTKKDGRLLSRLNSLKVSKELAETSSILYKEKLLKRR